MIGAWPFHDQSRHIGGSINRALIGGITVLPKHCGQPRPMGLPPMVADCLQRQSGALSQRQPRRAAQARGVHEAAVAIIDTDPMNMRFSPAEVHVQPGGKVHWTAGTVQTHTITEDGAGLPSYCFNGRSFVGNTPTILAHSGQKIRWYV